MASPVPAKSQPLHNFDLPRTLNWKKDAKSTTHPQRRRSVKSPSRRPNPSPIRHDSPLRESSSSPMETIRGVIEYRRTSQLEKKGKGTEETRRSSKILIKIPCKANKSEEEDDQNGTKLEAAEEGEENLEEGDEAKTWNLRPRKPIRRSLNVNGVVVTDKGKSAAAAQSPKNHHPMSSSINVMESRVEKRKLNVNVALTKEEIEEDIFAFTGTKPARRPRKRNRIAQKHVDFVFPGLWLVGITPESYRVSESSLKV